METYKYCLLVKNTHDKALQQWSTLIKSPFKPTLFALIERQCYDNYMPEKVNRIIYSDDLEHLTNLMETYISWYDYVTGYYKEMQQNVYKIKDNGTD